VIFHAEYADVSAEAVTRFVAAQELGRLVSVGPDGTPHLGLYPFVYAESAFDLHLVREDELVTDLEARPRCVFELDEVLAVVPSYWVHPEFAGSATAYHRTVIFECTATVLHDVDAVAAQQVRLLGRYQPEGGFRPVDPADALYRGALARLAAVRLDVLRCRPKFKLGQNRPVEVRRRVIAELRRRGRPADARAAEALEWTLGARDTAHTGDRAHP
jgi:predicted FMN-binding regulatory protein PaiB